MTMMNQIAGTAITEDRFPVPSGMPDFATQQRKKVQNQARQQAAFKLHIPAPAKPQKESIGRRWNAARKLPDVTAGRISVVNNGAGEPTFQGAL